MLFSSCLCISSHFANVPFHHMSWFFPGKGWQLICLKHTRKLTCIWHMNYHSRASYVCAAHNVWVMCSTWNTGYSLRVVHESWLTSSLFRVTHVFWLSHSTKLKSTCMFSAHECQLKHKLYCSFTHKMSLGRFLKCKWNIHTKSRQMTIWYNLHVKLYLL